MLPTITPQSINPLGEKKKTKKKILGRIKQLFTPYAFVTLVKPRSRTTRFYVTPPTPILAQTRRNRRVVLGGKKRGAGAWESCVNTSWFVVC